MSKPKLPFKTRTIGLKLNENSAKKLRIKAAREDIEFSELIRRILEAYLDKQKTPSECLGEGKDIVEYSKR